MQQRIYTIGHGNHRWETFLGLLKPHSIEVLVDVRSNPVSRFAPFANKRSLPSLLEREGMRYVYMGDTLGGKPADPALYDGKGKPDYRMMRSQSAFRDGVRELIGLMESYEVALMCAEEDPAKCHRRLLIGPALEAHGVRLADIRKEAGVQDPKEPAHHGKG